MNPFNAIRYLPLAAMLTGCTMPRYATSLDDILKQEGKSHRSSYAYRCTTGAHRGASDKYKENTMEALKAADDDRAFAFIEFDVQYSKDNRIVVYHDINMFRLFGSMRQIGDTTFAELSELTGGEIAPFSDVMAMLSKKLNIEIKSQGDQEEDERLVDEVIADIKTRKRQHDVLISSISSHVIEYVKRTYPEMPTGQILWLTSSTYLHFDSWTKKLYEDIKTTHADYLLLHNVNLRNIDDLLNLKPKGKTILFWDLENKMYIVHKDFSDRLWGVSGFRNFFQFLRYKIASPFY